MQKTFVDTAGWIALVNQRDALHRQAIALYRELARKKTPLITTEFVLMEVADAFAAPPTRQTAIAFLNGLRTETTLEIVPVSSELMAAGWTLYMQRPDKEWGLTDCTSFAVMAQQKITDAFTADHHFVQAGFNKLL